MYTRPILVHTAKLEKLLHTYLANGTTVPELATPEGCIKKPSFFAVGKFKPVTDEVFQAFEPAFGQHFSLFPAEDVAKHCRSTIYELPIYPHTSNVIMPYDYPSRLEEFFTLVNSAYNQKYLNLTHGNPKPLPRDLGFVPLSYTLHLLFDFTGTGGGSRENLMTNCLEQLCSCASQHPVLTRGETHEQPAIG